MRTTLAILALTLAIFATLGACRDGGGDGDGDCDDELAYCCWEDAGGVYCSVESYCDPHNPDDCYQDPFPSTWAMDDDLDLDGARAEWDGAPCHVEDAGLNDACQ